MGCIRTTVNVEKYFFVNVRVTVKLLSYCKYSCKSVPIFIYLY